MSVAVVAQRAIDLRFLIAANYAKKALFNNINYELCGQ